MSKKLNRVFEYKGYKFNQSIELNTKVEKRINGRNWHTLITNCMDGNNYYKKEELLSTDISICIEKHKKAAQEYVDALTFEKKTIEDQFLSELGFS